PMIYRHFSRRSPLKDFLATHLQGARRYDRICRVFQLLPAGGGGRGSGTDDDGCGSKVSLD
ncbi:MAG: hypothetical protein KKG10_00770, partial [Proteobacteria bacterium]|nr:hypothetical protein [Pseudomonadota bacterium]